MVDWQLVTQKRGDVAYYIPRQSETELLSLPRTSVFALKTFNLFDEAHPFYS